MEATSEPTPESERAVSRSRRRLLGAAGVGAGAAIAGTPGIIFARSFSEREAAIQAKAVRDLRSGRFSRIFEGLPPFAEPNEALHEAMIELGRPGGLLDANDPLEVGPVRLITEPELSPNNLDNPTHTAGATFFGQFLDHDLTRDRSSTLGQPLPVERSTNSSSARFDLSTVYGQGPSRSPELYTDDRTGRFRVESGGLFEDLPRGSDLRAIIPDPRNDENLILSGLQAAFLLFHNAVMDFVESEPGTSFGGQRRTFQRARQLVRWHYQWMILNEFLPLFVGQAMADDVRNNGRQFFRPRRLARIPVEFQGAAYRFGHSMVRPSYRANLAGDSGEAFFGFVFDPNEFDKEDPDDLNGGAKRAPRRFIGWQTFFDFGDGEVRPNKRIDTRISTPLFQLPFHALDTPADSPGPSALPVRNLLRHITWELPSGQTVAEAMGVTPLSPGDLADFQPLGANLDTSTPLWLYCLREAEVVNDGLFLGPVGGRIVAEVFVGLLELDISSFLNRRPGWRPTLPTRDGSDNFRMVDMLTFAGVDPVSRGQ